MKTSELILFAALVGVVLALTNDLLRIPAEQPPPQEQQP